jgi:hypothetical protein
MSSQGNDRHGPKLKLTPLFTWLLSALQKSTDENSDFAVHLLSR